MAVAPQQPVVTFFDPNKRDQGLIEIWSENTAAYVPLDIGAPHENTRDFPGFKLGIQTAIPDNADWIRRVWVTDETSPDWFNYQKKFAAEANAYPTYIRQYRIDKKTYTPLTKGSVLGSVIKIVLATAGSGYTPGTFPDVTLSGGSGSGFSGHAIVNLDGTIAELVIDDQGTGYTSTPTVTVDPPPVGTTATGTASIQEQTAYLVAEQAEEFPKDSEFFGLYFNVTRVYETLPGPTLYTTRQDVDGVIVTVATTTKEASSINSGETLVASVWSRTTKKQSDNSFIGDEVYEVRSVPGPLQQGEQTGKWGVEPISKQIVAYGTSVDEGFLVRESKVDKLDGSNLVGQKVTINYPSNVYGVTLQGQDYDPRLDAVIPYIQVIRPQGNDIGVNREDITPIDYNHADVRTIDPAIVQAVLDAYVFSYPGRINVDMPDILTNVYGVIDSSTSDGADSEVGSNSLTGAGSVAQTLTAQAQASANILPEAYPIVKQFWGNNIACSHYHFFLPNPVILSDVITKLNAIIGGSVADWPKFNPEIVTVVMTGGRVSVQAKAHSQGSYATSGTGTASTAAGGTGYSEERGLTIKTLRVSPTIHAEITISGDTSGSENVTATAYAEAAGLGPLETQSTGPISVTATVTPSTIPATVGATTWPTTGLYLYRTDPHPYRYGYIEFHCIVVDAADFPNVP